MNQNSTAGTENMATMPMGWRQVRIVLIASLGQFIGAGLATLVGIVIPLMEMNNGGKGLPGWEMGAMGCLSLIGIMIGTTVFGRLSDRIGYLQLFRACPLAIAATSLAVVIWPTTEVTLASLFVMGLAIGGEYSLDPDYISELVPVKWRLYMLGTAKALSALGSAAVAAVSYFVITRHGEGHYWQYLFLIITGVAVLMLALRINFAQSPQWLMSHGREAAAEKAAERLLGPEARVAPTAADKAPAAKQSLWEFVRGNASKIVLTGVPWACEGLGVYGIGIFMPVLIMSFHLDPMATDATQAARIAHSVGLTFALCMVMLAGFTAGLLLLKRVDNLKMQVWGFAMSVAGLGTMLAAYKLGWAAWTAIGGFVVFELFLNIGPHLIAFILPTRIYPVAVRGTGMGIAASVGKTGAVAGAFIVPVLLRGGGATLVLAVSIAVMALGGIVTWAFGRIVTREDKPNAI